MRTSITLDDDVYQLATLYAKGRGTTLSAAINELVRKVEAERRPVPDRLKTLPNGLVVIAARGKVITPEMVKEAEEDEFESYKIPG